MKLSVSNIGWSAEYDTEVYAMMQSLGFQGLEIAPTRIFPEAPYDRLSQARAWGDALRQEYGFAVPSMQSIWYGKQEKLFGTAAEREALSDYTKKAIDFAEAIGCRNLVFGCPRNRNMPDGADPELAVRFFRELGSYAADRGVTIGMEANPPIYHTNYINDTASALELIEAVDSDGFKLNLDLGTVIQNGEDLSEIAGKAELISHVHISEPGLKPIEKRPLHAALKALLLSENYQGYVSIEMGNTGGLSELKNAMHYVWELFR